MKVIYEFNITHEENGDDPNELQIFQNANKMYQVLFEIDKYIREIRKDYKTDTKEEMINYLQDLIVDSRFYELI